MVVGYGIVSRLLRSAVARVRAEGLRVGLLRPITLWPFPRVRLAELADEVRGFLVAELSTGQMVEDVRLAVCGKSDVLFYGRPGGAIVTPEEVYEQLRTAL